ncbi:hypothetical protein D3C73_1160270 [compost metagenome]
MGDDLAHAFRYVHLERVYVELVALPGQRLAVGGHPQAGQLVDGAGGRMVAGNPLRVQQGQRTGLGRHGGGHLEDAPGQVTCVDVNAQQARGGGITRWRGLRQRGRGRQREQHGHHQGTGFHRQLPAAKDFPMLGLCDAEPHGRRSWLPVHRPDAAKPHRSAGED